MSSTHFVAKLTLLENTTRGFELALVGERLRFAIELTAQRREVLLTQFGALFGPSLLAGKQSDCIPYNRMSELDISSI